MDWNTAVLLFPFAQVFEAIIGILLYYYPSTLLGSLFRNEDWKAAVLFFLLLRAKYIRGKTDWKTAVFILPFTRPRQFQWGSGLEDCRIYTSFY